MKISYRVILISVIFASFNSNPIAELYEDSVELNSYEEDINKIKYQAEMIDIMTRPGTISKLRLGNDSAEKISVAIKSGKPVSDEAIIKPAEISYTIAERLREIILRETMTYGPSGGLNVLKNLPAFKNELYGVSETIPESEILRMEKEAEGCRNNMATITPSAVKKYIGTCFTSLNDVAAIVSPISSEGKTYLKSISLVSSMINSKNEHLCVVSVYKDGVWITAKHCLPESQQGLDRYIISNKVRNKIDWSKVRRCKKQACDIVYIDMETPDISQQNMPVVNQSIKKLNWETEIFIPGVVYEEDMSYSLSEYSKSSISNINFLWSPVGYGFCRALDISKNSCFSHACNTVQGFSGAPIYTYNETSRAIELIAIHSGRDKDSNNCTEKAKTNYAHLTNFEGMQ